MSDASNYISALLAEASCFRCLSAQAQVEIQTYLLASITGQTTNLSQLVLLSKGLASLSIQNLTEIKSFLLTYNAGLSTDPSTMSQNAACFRCNSVEMQIDLQTYLLSNDPGWTGTKDPTALANLSKAFRGTSAKVMLQIQVYLLSLVKSLSASASDLMQMAKCMVCTADALVLAVASQAIDYVVPAPAGSHRPGPVPVKGPDPGRGGGISGGGTPTAPTNPIATDWATRVVANGGAPPSVSTGAAVSTFVDTLQAAGIWSKMIAVNVFAPDSLTAAITPLLKGPGRDPWTNLFFVAANLNVHGLIADGSTKQLKTGVIPLTAFANDNEGGISFYISEGNPTTGTQGSVGNIGYGVAFYTNNYSGDGNFYFACWDATSSNQVGYLAATPYNFNGFVSGSRESPSTGGLYMASPSLAFTLKKSFTGTSGTRPENEMYVFSLNGTTATMCNFRLSFYAIHHGLTAAETQTLYNAVDTLRSGLGGGNLRTNRYDDMESYTDAAALNGLSGGTGWGGSYVGR